jgi:hypothetical protein
MVVLIPNGEVFVGGVSQVAVLVVAVVLAHRVAEAGVAVGG